LPAGTANVWATEARIPRDPRGVARLVAGGRTVRAVLGDVNGEPFFLFVGAGIDARIVRRVEMGRARRNHRGGMAQWVWPACREFVGRPLADLTVTVNGETHEGLAQVLVTRVRSYAGMMKLPGGIDIADGALHVILFPRRSKARLVATGLRATLGRLRPGRDITQLTTEGPIRIASATGGEPFHRDGDHGGELPVEVKLSGREVQLLVP